MREKNQLAVPFEIKQVSDAGEIIGYGAVFNNVDFGMDVIAPGAFKESIRERRSIPMLWQHYSDEPIGVWEALAEDKHGLQVMGQLNLSKDSGQADVPMAFKARALAKQGAVTGLSIGFYPVDFRYENDVRVLEKIELLEVSLATFPMNPLARVVDAKNVTNKEFVQLARSRLGLSRDAAEALRSGGLPSLRDYVTRKGCEETGSRQTGNELLDSLRKLKSTFEG